MAAQRDCTVDLPMENSWWPNWPRTTRAWQLNNAKRTKQTNTHTHKQEQAPTGRRCNLFVHMIISIAKYVWKYAGGSYGRFRKSWHKTNDTNTFTCDGMWMLPLARWCILVTGFHERHRNGSAGDKLRHVIPGAPYTSIMWPAQSPSKAADNELQLIDWIWTMYYKPVCQSDQQHTDFYLLLAPPLRNCLSFVVNPPSAPSRMLPLFVEFTFCYGLKGAAWNTINKIFFRSEIKHALWKHHLDNISLHAGWKVNFVQDGYVELLWGSLMRHGCSLNPIPSPRELLFSISSPSTNRSVPQTMIKMVQTGHRFVDTDSSTRQCWWGFCYWHAGLAHHSDVDLWTHQKNLEKMPAINNLDGFRIFF